MMKQAVQRVNGKDRYTLENNFEDVYLRSRTLRRFMDKVDTEMMASKETQKVIEHLTDRQMGVYGRIFGWNGFDRDDIRSIVSVFAACFTGLGVKKKSKRDYYYLMMSFVDQRMEFFTGCVIRKFQVNDVSHYNVSHSLNHVLEGDQLDPTIDLAAAEDSIKHFTSGQPLESEPTWLEKAEELEDRVEILKMQHATAVKQVEPNDKIESISRAIERLTTVAQSYRQEANKDAQKDRSLSAELKKRLAEDPLKYADQLAYYATYKGIPYDVRRAARTVCKRHGIDYVARAKSKIGTYSNADDAWFDLR